LYYLPMKIITINSDHPIEFVEKNLFNLIILCNQI
jgi:hypothetical protein